MKSEQPDLVELIEQEMLILWADEVSIPKLLKDDAGTSKW